MKPSNSVSEPMHLKLPTADDLQTSFPEISVSALVDAIVKAGVWKHPKLSAWVEHRFQLLEEFRIAQDVQRLTTWGANKETLGLSMFIINLAPGIDHYLKQISGTKRAQKRDVRTLERAAVVLERMEGLFPGTPDMMLGIPGFALSAKALKQHATMLVWGGAIYSMMGAKSFLEVAKYALAGFVKRATGKFHDREVSALTGASLQNFDYDETAHRVWRIRAYPRLEKSFPIAPKLLQAFNQVLSRD